MCSAVAVPVPVPGCSGFHCVMCGREGVGTGWRWRRATSIDHSVFQKMKGFRRASPIAHIVLTVYDWVPGTTAGWNLIFHILSCLVTPALHPRSDWRHVGTHTHTHRQGTRLCASEAEHGGGPKQRGRKGRLKSIPAGISIRTNRRGFGKDRLGSNEPAQNMADQGSLSAAMGSHAQMRSCPSQRHWRRLASTCAACLRVSWSD